MLKLTLGLLFVGTFAAGCATLTYGTTDTLDVKSDPSGAAVSVPSEVAAFSTPHEIELDRDEVVFIDASLEGCDRQFLNVFPELDRGRALFAGLVDVASGALYEIERNEFVIKMACYADGERVLGRR